MFSHAFTYIRSCLHSNYGLSQIEYSIVVKLSLIFMFCLYRNIYIRKSHFVLYTYIYIKITQNELYLLGGVVWRVKCSDRKLVCAVGSRNGIEDTKLLVLDFDVY